MALNRPVRNTDANVRFPPIADLRTHPRVTLWHTLEAPDALLTCVSFSFSKANWREARAEALPRLGYPRAATSWPLHTRPRTVRPGTRQQATRLRPRSAQGFRSHVGERREAARDDSSAEDGTA